jgi:hypothetical protein
MTLKPRLLSWRPPLTFTGQSKYGVNTFDGKLLYQRDTWDAVQNNSFPSVRAVDINNVLPSWLRGMTL